MAAAARDLSPPAHLRLRKGDLPFWDAVKLGIALPFEPFGQGHVSMAPAMDTTEIAFLNEQVLHGGNPVMTICAANAVVEKNAAGDRKLNKAKSTGRIDGMVALVMAMGVAAMKTDDATSVDDWIASLA